MWYTLLIVIHVLSCIFLVTVVLLQQGKGADIGAVFGGSSQTLFGSSGAGNFLTKLTSATAIIFMLTSLSLTYGAAKRTTRSIFDSAPKSAPAPATPQETPAAQPSAGTENKEAAAAPTGEPAQAAPAATSSTSEPAQSAPAATSPTSPPTGQSSPTASQGPATK